ncbi:MAG: hypothetical protein IKO53_02075 [Lachnospiraceae bacterium]|nr:hypothetical protein [Lachnospiraceae bacterium]
MAKENAVFGEIDAELMKWLDEDAMKQDSDLGDVESEAREIFGNLMEAYNKDEEADIVGSLPEDARLLTELAEKKAAALRLEEEDAIPKELEHAYTDYLDAYFKAAKVINPLGGFGKVRLERALGILRGFEDKHWPLMTRITNDNIKSFRNLIPDEQYDDIVAGRKRALGALRMKNGRRCCAGAAVYRVEAQTITALPVIRLDWIYVPNDFREQGVANMLMAELVGLALQDDEAFLSVNMNIPDDSDKEVKEESVALEAFIRSWNFRLRVDTGRVFFIRLSSLKDNKYLKDQAEGVRSLAELGSSGRDMVQRFFRNRNKDYDEGIRVFSYEHYDFFDPDVSGAIVNGGIITALFLVHRYPNGNYRYEVMRCSHNTDPVIFLQLMRHGYHQALRKGDGSGMFFGAFESAEGYMTTAKMIPDTMILTQLAGTIMPPRSKETVSYADWAKLKKAAGHSEDE